MDNFTVEEKIGRINLWRKRCDFLHKNGRAVSVENCKPCNDIASEICEDIRKANEKNVNPEKNVIDIYFKPKD